MKHLEQEEIKEHFYEGENFVPLINNNITEYLSDSYFLFVPPRLSEKCDFSGLLGKPDFFTQSMLGLETDNPYFYYSPMLPFDNRTDSFYNISVTGGFRDITPLIDTEYQQYIITTDW